MPISIAISTHLYICVHITGGAVRAAGSVASVQVGARREQQLHNLEGAAVAGDAQRRGTLDVGLPWVAAPRDVKHIYLSIYLSIYTYIHTYIHACMHACIHTFIHTLSAFQA